jgi:hypothetical protein
MISEADFLSFFFLLRLLIVEILFLSHAVQKDLWAIYPPKHVQWPSRAEKDFFLDIYDWDTLELLPGSSSRLSLAVQLCTGLFPCYLNIEGREGANLLRSSGGNIVCLNQIGCSGVQVSVNKDVIYIYICIRSTRVNLTRVFPDREYWNSM